jgi:hypothetical protein
LAHGQTVRAYLTSTVPYGQSCTAETRSCNNGTLYGSYTFGSCNPGQPASCNFNGTTIPHGGSVTAYQSPRAVTGVSTCQAQTRTCNNGTLWGSGDYASCTVEAPRSCRDLDGRVIAHGTGMFIQSSVVWYGYIVSVSDQRHICNADVVSCSDGEFKNRGTTYNRLCSDPRYVAYNGSLSLDGFASYIMGRL